MLESNECALLVFLFEMLLHFGDLLGYVELQLVDVGFKFAHASFHFENGFVLLVHTRLLDLVVGA